MLVTLKMCFVFGTVTHCLMMDMCSEKCVIGHLLICKIMYFCLLKQTQMTLTLLGSLIIEDHYPSLGPWLTKTLLCDT